MRTWRLFEIRSPAKAYMHGISFDLTHALIIETLGIPKKYQLGFPYAVSAAPRETDLARALCLNSLSAMATNLRSLLFDDDDGDDDDDDDDDGDDDDDDDGEFTIYASLLECLSNLVMRIFLY
ncbi:hypothetical protein F0562_006080 [Nyssa sinensis]|uniref:Uncharacterized protein n=1 Tax=Nyssa sinensis TaxID=561372 RepID=A0A5J5AQR3_9ASTE|nr:hypothetical protein F0562_006080 [Nyssa sinensis]